MPPVTDYTHDGPGEESPVPTSPMQSVEVPEEAAHLLAELEESPFSTSDGSDDPNRASLIDALRRFRKQPERQGDEDAVFCPKCGSRACGHGMEPVTLAQFEELHPPSLPAPTQPPPGEVEGLRERLATPIHELASSLGRARVHLNNDSPALAKRELNGAAEALGWLRKALDSLPSDPQGEQGRCERCGGSKTLPFFGPETDRKVGAILKPCPDCNPASTQVEGERRELEPWEQAEAEGIVERLIAGLRQAAGPRTGEAVNVSVAAQNVHLAADLLDAQRRKRQPDPGGEEDWPAVEMWRLTGIPDDLNEVYKVDDGEGMPDDPTAYETRRYIPAPSQDSLGLEEQLRECEEALRSAEAQHAEFRKDMLEELRGDTGGSVESLSWQQLLGVATRNGNEAMRQADRAGRAEKALQDLAAEFEQGAERSKDDAYSAGLNVAAIAAREKAAELRD